MDLREFTAKVVQASDRLRQLWPSGEASEALIVRVTREAGLVVVSEDVSLAGDPVRLAIFFKAYNPSMKVGMSMDQVIEDGWRWQLKYGSAVA